MGIGFCWAARQQATIAAAIAQRNITEITIEISSDSLLPYVELRNWVYEDGLRPAVPPSAAQMLGDGRVPE